LNVLKDSDLKRAFETAEKAFTQFIKTRPSASKSSLIQSKSIDFAKTFPMVQGNPVLEKSIEVTKFMEELRNFKPKEAYLELRNTGKLHSGEKNDHYVQILEKIKKQ